MGAFVLGVLVGWLAEWLFYTYWVKAGDNSEDCSKIKAELELKNRQISSLQTQLASMSEGSTDNASNSTNTKANKTTQKSAKKATAASTASTKSSSKNSNKSASKSTTKTKTSSAAKTNKSSASKTKTTAASKKKAKPGGDDFTKLSGIGPSMSATLKSLGIDTFEKLASTDDDILRDMIEQSGIRMNNNKDVMDSWNEQATVAATGDFKALKAMQADLKK